MDVFVKHIEGKQPSMVRGNKIRCINYSQCPMCYGCRAYDSRDIECQECKLEDINVHRRKNYNICNTQLHEAWKINKIMTKNTVFICDEFEFENGGIK